MKLKVYHYMANTRYCALLLFLACAMFLSCSNNYSIGRYTVKEPVLKKCSIIEYYPGYDVNHWIVLQDSVGQYLYVSQPGRYPNKLFVSREGDHRYDISVPIKGKKQLFIGDTIQVALYKYKDHPRGFHLAERSCANIGLGDGHLIRTDHDWVENIYYCPDIELINELIYRKDH